MINKLIGFMRQTPMYRSMLYFLWTVLAAAIVLSIFDVLPYDPLAVTLATGYLSLICWAFSVGLGRLAGAKPNPESSLISGAILALIVGPLPFFGNILELTFIALAAMASKYVLVWRGSHIFNPAAFGVLASALLLDTGASWWVGSVYLLPVVLAGGLYEAYFKNNRVHLVFSFLGAYAVFFVTNALLGGSDLSQSLESLWVTLRNSAILFFVLVMLVEPLTSPAERNKRIYFGVAVAALAVGLPEVLKVPYTLELSLLLGNVFAALSGNHGRLLLKLVRKEHLGPNIIGFWFRPSPARQFVPGQFLNYTLPHRHADSRGSRRFFSVASSPTENNILLATKFAEKSSSFKKALRVMQTGGEIAATRPEGDFVMPPDVSRPLIFVAGGIGVTPYRSMIKYLLDKGEERPITLIYAARSPKEFVFKKLFDQAEKSLGLKTLYVANSPDWKGQKGPLTGKLIKQTAAGQHNPLYYISGPEPMVRALAKQLRAEGIPARRIKHDYFPGYSK